MSKAEDEALAASFKYGSGPFTDAVQGYAPLGADPFGIYPEVPSEKSAEPAPKKES